VFPESQLAAFQKEGKDPEAIKAAKALETGVYYRLMVDHVRRVLGDIKRVVPDYQSGQGYQLAGFVWFQGWNDMVDSSTYPQRGEPGGYGAYSVVMAQLIRDVRKDLNAPKLPFVIGVLGIGGPTAEYGPGQQRYKTIHDNFRNAMAAPAEMPEFQGNVAAVRTEKFWDQELTAAREKENGIKQRAGKLAEDGQLPPAAARTALEAMLNEGLTKRERLVLEKGISNLEYHYLGSAKILGSIGQGLAEAMTGLNPPTHPQ
jgi:alpha-galactosidase